MRGDMAASRLSMLGQLYNQERERDNPYTRLQAGAFYGALPREIQQQRAQAGYQTQLGNILFPYQNQAQIANQLLGYQPWYQPQFYEEPSTFSKISSAAGPLLGKLGGNLLGGAFGGGGGTPSASTGGINNAAGGGSSRNWGLGNLGGGFGGVF